MIVLLFWLIFWAQKQKIHQKAQSSLQRERWLWCEDSVWRLQKEEIQDRFFPAKARGIKEEKRDKD